MKLPSPLRMAALAVLTSTSLLHAQSTWITAGSGDWTNDTNWNPIGVPNAVDAVVVYTNSGYPVTNSLTDTNVTVGTINLFGSNSVILGNVPGTNDFLTLATSTGTPVINVTNASNVLYIYAQLQGSNGFTKNGPGSMTFRFNTNGVHTYTGTINLNGGELGLNNDNSLGDSNNPVIFLTNAVLNSAASTNGNIALNANRTITINTGATARLKNQTLSNTLTIDGQITGGGALTFDGTGTGSNAATSLRYFINGSNNYAGSTTVNGGAWVTLGSGAALGTNALSLSGGASTNTAFTVDLGGTTQNFGNLTVGSSTVYTRTITVSNGTLNITNPTGAFSFNGTNGTIWSMSNAATFTFVSGGTPRNFTIQPSTGGITNTSGVVTNIVTPNTNIVFFGRVSNQVTAPTNRVGGAAGASGGTNHMALLFLGTNNTFNSTTFEIGGFNGEGEVDFMADVTNGGIRLRGTNGTSPMPFLVAGNTSSGVRSGAGRINLGIADAVVSNTIIGNFNANNVTNRPTTNSITMAGGSFASTNLILGAVTNTNIIGNAVTINSTFQQNGGTSAITLIRMGDDRNTNATTNAINYVSTYNVSSSNAVLRAATIDAGTNAFFGTGSSRKINFGAGRIETLDSSTDLTISGFNTSAAGRIEIAVASNAQTKTFFADTGRKITLEPSAVLTFDGGITKDGAGTLVLKGTNTHNGDTTVAAGTLELQSTGSLRFQIGGSGTNNKINGAGTASLDGQFIFNLASASTNNGDTWNIVSNSLTANYGTNFIVTGFSGAGGSWTNTTNGVDYVFSQSSGNLTVVSTSSPTPYNAWVTYWQGVDPGFTNTAGTADPDGDQFDNNEEFAFDGNPTVGTPALLTATKSGTNTIFNYVALTNTNAATYVVQTTTNLATIGSWSNASVTISNSANTNGINIPADYVRKEFTVPAAGNSFYRVQAAIAP